MARLFTCLQWPMESFPFLTMSCLPLFQEVTTHTARFMHKAMYIINSAVSNADCWRGMKLTTPKKTFFSKL